MALSLGNTPPTTKPKFGGKKEKNTGRKPKVPSMPKPRKGQR